MRRSVRAWRERRSTLNSLGSTLSDRIDL
ncbi:MAG: hypothetical protein DMF95_01600 [Acidobacteria bacterium]|nr:MAG: hypothetical protein DMF95_01600 [Acidobacteriota bacterium]